MNSSRKISKIHEDFKHHLKEKFGILRSGIITFIRLYQIFLSPIFTHLNGGGCRFYPTCSEYSLFCFKYLPLYQAFYFSILRILKCNPYNKGGSHYPPGYRPKN